jgi:preprotein translocase subunit SecD
LVSRVAAVTGRDLRDASASQDENGQPAVGFNLTNEGGQKFYAFTSAHVKDMLAVVLDNKVQSVATKTNRFTTPESLKGDSPSRR